VNELPQGWTDVQVAGFYRIEQRKDDALFGMWSGPIPGRSFFSPPPQIFTPPKDGKCLKSKRPAHPRSEYGFLGVRSCECNAIAIQDKGFCQREEADTHLCTLRKSTSSLR